MIKTHIPYHTDKKLFEAYNDFMSRLKKDEWACFLDHDAMFTTRNWYFQLMDIIKKHPQVACYTVVTNRIHPNAINQLYPDPAIRENHDIRLHRKIGQQLSKEKWNEIAILPRTSAFSGVVILYSRKKWEAVPFRAFQKASKIPHFLGVDNQLHWDLIDHGEQVAVMKGVYVYHWYRADGDRSHLV